MPLRKAERLYALCVFKKMPDGRRSFYRLSGCALPRAAAVVQLQSAMLYASLNGFGEFELRPVRMQISPTAPGNQCIADIVEGLANPQKA